MNSAIEHEEWLISTRARELKRQADLFERDTICLSQTHHSETLVVDKTTIVVDNGPVTCSSIDLAPVVRSATAILFDSLPK
jgi:hypothetical protein